MYQTVIVPLEGSCHCERAVLVALEEARHRQATIVLLHVIPRPENLAPDPRVQCGGPAIRPFDWPEQALANATQQAFDYLELVKRRHRLPESTVTRVTVGEPVRRILAEADLFPQPLIVMTTGETTSDQCTTLSQVARRVLAHGTVPVLGVPTPRTPNPPAITGPAHPAASVVANALASGQ